MIVDFITRLREIFHVQIQLTTSYPYSYNCTVLRLQPLRVNFSLTASTVACRRQKHRQTLGLLLEVLPPIFLERILFKPSISTWLVGATMRYSILAHTTIQLMLNLSATSAGRLRISSQSRHLKEEECPILFDTTCSNSTSNIPVCGAFMGNGQMWNAHLPATARIIEAMGPIGGIVGSSSAALTVFFLESI